jgi:hypothetical protein
MGSTLGRGAGAAGLVLLMAVGSVVMWIGVPVFWLWAGSQIHESSEPSMGIYVLVLVGIVVSMAAIGKGLGVVNRWHMALTGSLPRRREQTVWLKSMRGDAAAKREHGILASVMVVSVGIALTIFGAWFLFFSEGTGGGI